MRFLALFSFAAIAVFTLHSSRAHACIGLPACTSFAPEGAATLPTSIPGFPIVGRGAVEIRDAHDDIVETKVRDDGGYSFLEPVKPLTAGTYTASWSSACSGEGNATTTLTIVEAAPVPTQTGTVSVAGAERRKTAGGGNSPDRGCLDPLDAAFVTIAIAPDPLLTPYLPIVGWETTIDGVARGVQLPFAPRHDFTRAGAENLDSAGPLATRIYAICDGERHNVTGVKPGTHDVQVRARLLGGAEIEPAHIRVRVSCIANNGEVVDPSGPLEEEQPPALPLPGPSEPSDEDSNFDIDSDQRGCSASPARASGVIGAAMLAVVGVALRRRRHRGGMTSWL